MTYTYATLSTELCDLPLPTFSLLLTLCNLSFYARGLRSAAPAIWNSLPSNVCSCETLTTFRRHLKSHLFHSAFATAERPISAPLIRPRRRFINIFTYLLSLALCFLSGRWKMPPPTRHCMRRLRRSYRRRHQRLFQQPQLLAACELCGFVSGHRAVVARHRRLCSRPPGTCFSCDRCPWTGDSVATYVDHRNTAHGDHIAVFKYVSRIHLHARLTL